MFLGAALARREWGWIIFHFAIVIFWWYAILNRERKRPTLCVAPYRTWDATAEKWVDFQAGDFETKRTLAVVEHV